MTDEPTGDGPRGGRRSPHDQPRVTTATAAGQAARRDRLAGALRDNLRRRKAQTRARRPAEGPADGADQG